jgi:microcystin-dependent protein
MNRVIVYPGQIPLETDVLQGEKNALIGMSKIAAAILGTGTLLNGLACAATSPASMSVDVGAGEIFALKNIDDTAYSTLAADTTHQILKTGIALDKTTLACPAPATVGNSINYLVQIAYSDVDDNPIALPYYNSTNPAQAYVGPNGSGVAQNTTRNGVCVVSIKTGVSAPTGSQVTPSPDPSNVGAWVISVAQGATTITAGNIAQYPGAPFITTTLTNLAPLASPALTGAPTAPTQANNDRTTKLATTAFVWTALAGVLSKSVAGNTDVTLTAVEAGNGILNLTGALTGNINVIVPTQSGEWIVRNNTTGNFSLTVKTAAGAGIVVSHTSPGNSVILYCDGTDVASATSSSSGGQQAGEVCFFARNTAPTGFLKANGAAVSRSTYSDLFAALVSSATATISIASPGVVTWTAHAKSANDPVKFSTTGALPSGLVAGTVYYVVGSSITTNTFTVSSTPGGSAINTTGTQSGTHTAINAPFGDGDGSTTFNVPDLRGEFPRGWDDSRSVDTSRSFGSLQLDAMQGHFHNVSGNTSKPAAGGSNVNDYISTVSADGGVNSGVAAPKTDGTNGTPRTAAENRPRNVALLACIKY